MVSDRSNGIYRSVVAALIGWLILVGANPPSENPRSNSGTADSNQSAKNEKDIASGIGSIGKALEAQNAKSDPYEEERNEREIRDLQAQENSAYWAKGMFWATVAALVLSFIGIGLVWTTFRETRKSNEIAMRANARATRQAIAATEETKGALTIAARNADAAVKLAEEAEKTAERQLRPYVFVTDAVLVGTENDGAAINISFKNFGATPAYGVTIQSGVAIVRLPVESSPTLDNDVSCASVIAPRQQIETSAIVEGVDAFHAALRQNDCIILRTKITYEISPGVSDCDEQTVIMDTENITNGRFRFPLEGEILNP